MILYFVKNVSKKPERIMHNPHRDIYDPSYNVTFPKGQDVQVDGDFYNYLHRWPQFFIFREEVIEESAKKLEELILRVEDIEKRLLKSDIGKVDSAATVEKLEKLTARVADIEQRLLKIDIKKSKE